MFSKKSELKERLVSMLGFAPRTELKPEDYPTAAAYAAAVAEQKALERNPDYRQAERDFHIQRTTASQRQQQEDDRRRLAELKQQVELSDREREEISARASRDLEDAVASGTVPRDRISEAARTLHAQHTQAAIEARATAMLFNERLRSEIKNNVIEEDDNG